MKQFGVGRPAVREALFALQSGAGGDQQRRTRALT
jgi:hypothetical protein